MKFDLEKALSHPIVLIGGEEDVLRRRACATLLEAASGGDDFDVEGFFGDSSQPSEWLGSCGTTPFLSPRRVALVRNLLRSEGHDDLGKPSLPETALLILVADSEGGDDSKQRTLAARAKRWEKTVKDAGGFVYQATIGPKAFEDLVKQELADRGLKMAPPAIATLQEMVGGNLSVALGELEKISLYIGDRTQIAESDVKAVVVPAREWSVFKLIDAIFGGNPGEALKQLRVMVGSNPKPESPALGSVLPMLNRQLRLVWQARLFVEAKASLTSPPELVRSQLPGAHSLLAQKEYPQKIAMQSASKVTFSQLVRCFELLAETEARIKGSDAMFSTSDTLDQMVLEMTQVVSRPSGSSK